MPRRYTPPPHLGPLLLQLAPPVQRVGRDLAICLKVQQEEGAPAAATRGGPRRLPQRGGLQAGGEAAHFHTWGRGDSSSGGPALTGSWLQWGWPWLLLPAQAGLGHGLKLGGGVDGRGGAEGGAAGRVGQDQRGEGKPVVEVPPLEVRKREQEEAREQRRVPLRTPTHNVGPHLHRTPAVSRGKKGPPLQHGPGARTTWRG
jgi:hypothetical protein